MKKISVQLEPHFERLQDFEAATRNVRWLNIVAVLVVFPWNPPQNYYAYIVIAALALYNLSRYPKKWQKWGPHASPKVMFFSDFCFVSWLVFVSGTVMSPFAMYYIFIIITAAYLYRLKGALIILAAQMAMMYLIMMVTPFAPIELSPYREVLLVASITAGFGMFIERVTRIYRKQAADVLSVSRDSEAQRGRLEAVVNSVGDAIFVVDDDGRILKLNSAARWMCGREDNLTGIKLNDVLKLYPHTNLNHAPINILHHKQMLHRRDLSIKVAGDVVIDLDTTVQPIVLADAGATEYVVICKDISRERRLDEQRSTFISVAAHELRTPIAIMEASLSTVMVAGRDKLDPQLNAIMKQAHENSVYLSSIVHDLTTLSAASNDNVPVVMQNMDAGALVERIAASYTGQALEKGLELRIAIEPGIASVMSNEHNVQEILQNFITNSLKYTDDGQVLLKVEPAKTGGVLFSVHDTGMGIDKKDQDQLFKKFFRSEDERTQQINGTGLGLYLCAEIAQRINGRIWCESEINKGSTFYLEVPPTQYTADGGTRKLPPKTSHKSAAEPTLAAVR